MPSQKVGVLTDKGCDLRTIFGRIAEDGIARNRGIPLGFGHSSVLAYFILGSGGAHQPEACRPWTVQAMGLLMGPRYSLNVSRIFLRVMRILCFTVVSFVVTP